MKRDDLEFVTLGGIAAGVDAARRRPLRFLTAGSVDDGKSTLIGRLLLDGQALLADQLDALHARAAGGAPDLSLVTDGLESEREQGITIDVAHRYFATPARKFIIADAPGHEQYTRNMVTAAAGSDAAIVLVDATKLRLDDGDAGAPVTLLPQTRRHALIARLVGVPAIVFAVNKLDAVADPGRAFARVHDAVLGFAAEAGIDPAGIVPISALRGDNVTTRSSFVAYDGPTLLELLESLPDVDAALAADDASELPVQYVDAGGVDSGRGDRARVLWGRVARGRFSVGQDVVVWPSGEPARIAALHDSGGAAAAVAAGRSAGVVLDRQLDVSRGDWLASPAALKPAASFAATLAWLDTEPATPGRKYLLRHGNRWLQARLTIASRIDIETLRAEPAERLAVNDIGTVVVDAQEALPLRRFAEDRVAGSAVVVDPATHRTSGVLLVEEVLSS